jgi:hypothetical protein
MSPEGQGRDPEGYRSLTARESRARRWTGADSRREAAGTDVADKLKTTRIVDMNGGNFESPKSDDSQL